jgi:hypothetical protein
MVFRDERMNPLRHADPNLPPWAYDTDGHGPAPAPSLNLDFDSLKQLDPQEKDVSKREIVAGIYNFIRLCRLHLLHHNSQSTFNLMYH